MASVSIYNNGSIELILTSPRSKVRICDANGNHVAKPTSQSINFSDHYIEWMITNNDLIKLISRKFTTREIRNLKKGLQRNLVSLRNSKFYSRAAKKKNIHKSIGGFSVYEYKEVFYSFEKKVNNNIQVKVTFKMGDFTLAAHMFVLIGLFYRPLLLKNKKGNIHFNNRLLGSGAKCIWNPSKRVIKEILRVLACSSEDHKNDLIDLLDQISN